MLFTEVKNLQEAYTRIQDHSGSLSWIQTNTNKMWQMSVGVVKTVSENRMEYTVEMKAEGVTVPALLFLDKAYYQIIGFPNVDDTVKVFHKNGLSTVFIIARVNSHLEELVMDQNSSIPMGSNMP
jgi:hypothetical protein